MAISGSAFAQGLLKGVGDAGQKYFEDQRRERMDTRKMSQAFDMFTKQTDYSTAAQAEKEKGIAMYKAGMEGIGTMNTQRTEWERVSKMGIKDIVYENALEASKTFEAKDRPAFIRDYMKRKNGINKTVAMNDRGLTLPDYSRYAGKEEYKDAIPQAFLAGDPSMPDADALYKFDPEAGFMKELEVQSEKLTDAQRQRTYDLQTIGDATLLNFQAEPSDRLKSYILGKRGKEGDTMLKGADVISMDNTRIASMIASKQIHRIHGELKFESELDDEERELLGLPTQPSPDTESMYSGKEFTEPNTEAYLEEQKAKATRKEELSMAKQVGDKHGKLLSSYGALEELTDATQTLSEGAKGYLYGEASWKGLGAVSDKVTQLAAKTGDADAQEAAAYLALVTNITARIKHDQYGSAQTLTELTDFASQLGRPGLFQNPDTLLDQIAARKESVGRDIRSSIGDEQRTAYLNQHKDTPYLSAAFGIQEETPEGTPEGAPVAGTNEQKVRQEIPAFVDTLIASGEYDESEREGLTEYLINKALQPIE